MNISLEDFNALSAERSSRDVRIAQLEMEKTAERMQHQRELESFKAERDALWKENQELRKKIEWMQADYENLRFENHWMKQYILISMDRVRYFFSHIRNIEVLSAIRSFVLEVLPDDTPDEAYTYVSKAMNLPKDDGLPTNITNNHYINFSGNDATYNENAGK